MTIKIRENQKKLFVPRDIDGREDRLNNEIRGFLTSIKDSIVWEYLGEITNDYNYESDYGDTSYYDTRGMWLEIYTLEDMIISDYGIQKVDEFKDDIEKINKFMIDFLDLHGEGQVTYVVNSIKYYGVGKLGYSQERTISIFQKIRSVKI